MNDFPWIVICGISDSANSHRNDDWQPDVAATAVELAKKLHTYREPAQGMLAYKDSSTPWSETWKPIQYLSPKPDLIVEEQLNLVV